MRRLLIFVFTFIAVLAATGVYLYYQRKQPSDFLVLYGNVDVRQVDLGFRVSGRVQKMLFEEGDFVPQGVLMGALDKQPYLDQERQARAIMQSTAISLKYADIVLKRRKELVVSGSVSQEDYDNALSARDVSASTLKQNEASLGVSITNLKDTEVFSPADGTILTRVREPGTVVREADPIYTLSLISPVWIRAFVAEPFLGLVYPGMPAEVYTDTPGGEVYKGHVGFISPTAEFTPKTVETTELRTDLVYRLRIIADNPDKGLRQGMPVTVKLYLKQKNEEAENPQSQP